MADAFYLGAYWGARPEPAQQCAARLSRCLGALATASPALATWYRKGDSADVRYPVGTGAAELTELLLSGRNRRDMDGSVLEQLGFRAGLWNGGSPAVEFTVACGASPRGRPQANNALLKFPSAEGEALALYDLAVMRRVLAAVVEAWDPDWATVTSHPLRTAQAAAPGTPIVGWLTYLSSPAPASVPPPTTVEPMSAGSLVVTGRSPLEVSADQVIALRRAADLDNRVTA